MAVVSRTSFTTGDIPTTIEWNAQFDTIYNEFNGNIDAANMDATFNATIAKIDENEVITGAWAFGVTSGVTATGGYSGIINTAAQTNITSLGTLTSLAVSGDITISSAAIDIDLADNNAAALSIDTAGLAGMLLFNTANGSEIVSTSANFRPENDISTAAGASIWVVQDNAADSFSFDASGKTGILLIDSTNGAETVRMSGALVVTGTITGLLATAAQTNITSLGTLTTLTVDNLNLNGNTIITSDSNGDLVLTPNGTGSVVVGPANSSAFGKLVVSTASGEASIDIDGNSSSSQAWIYLRSVNSGVSGIALGDGDDHDICTILHDHSDNGLKFRTNNSADRMIIAEDGGIFFSSLLSAGASTDVNINGSNELHSVTSSLRFKENVRPMEEDGSLIYKLDPKTYEFKEDGMTEFGLIAEEVETVFPCLVVKDEAGPYSVKYSRLAVLLLPEMKRLNERITALEGV